jgi:hypothetical protein
MDADFHSIRDLFAGKAFQQRLHRLLLASRQLKLLDNLRKKKESRNASLEQKLNVRVRRASYMPVQMKDTAAIMSPSGYKLRHET